VSRELEDIVPDYSDNFLTWQTIDALLGVKQLKLLNIWLFVVPMLVQLTLYLPENIHIFLQGNSAPLKLSLDVPFSWKLLYFSALLVGVARIAYIYRCPVFVRENKTATDAISAGMTAQYVKSEAADFIGKCFKNKLPRYESVQGQNLRKLLRQYRTNVEDVEAQWSADINEQEDVGILLFDALERVEFEADENGHYVLPSSRTYKDTSLDLTRVTISNEQFLKHQCWDLIKLQNLSFEKSRGLITCLLIGALLLAAWPLFQSIWFVLGTLFCLPS
jgi:hypothetical protein